MKMKMDNYKKAQRAAEREFLKWDSTALIKKFSLKSDSDYLYINFLKAEYRINKSTALAERSIDGFVTFREANFNEALSIYDVLCQSREDRRLSGEWSDIRSLPGVVLGNPERESDFFNSLRGFAHKTEKLEEACISLGGVKTTGADVAYIIPTFEFLPVLLKFWDEDEEFPASAKLMWDKNVLQYLRFETSYYVAGELYSRLLEFS